MICVSIGRMNYHEALAIAREADMIEIRQDLCGFGKSEVVNLIQTAPRSVFTYRPGDETPEERLLFFGLAIDAGAAFVDIEYEAATDYLTEVKKLLAASETELIISYHNFEETPQPEVLTEILKNCYTLGGQVAKIACQANSGSDAASLLSLYRKKGRKLILGMGEAGMISRVAAVPMGAEFTFAAPDTGNATAPGQLKVSELKDIFNILKIY